MQIIIRLVTLFIMGSYLIIMDLSWKTSATSGVQHRENFPNDSLLPDNIRLFPPVSSSFYSNISLVQSSISYTFHQHNNIITNITQADDTHRKLFFSNKLLTKRTIKLVIYDKIRGYLNWQQDWFIQAAKDECSNDYSCELSEDQSDVSGVDVDFMQNHLHPMAVPNPYNFVTLFSLMNDDYHYFEYR